MKTSIPTEYAGVTMRSRLETLAARAFDRDGISWEYEPLWLRIPGIFYQPDFALEGRIVCEVKGWWDQMDRDKIDAYLASLSSRCEFWMLWQTYTAWSAYGTPEIARHAEVFVGSGSFDPFRRTYGTH